MRTPATLATAAVMGSLVIATPAGLARLREDGRVLLLLGGTCLLGTLLGTLGVRAPSRVRTRAFFQAATGVQARTQLPSTYTDWP